MPKNYDDIVRSTVPEPDSSFRPTKQQIDDTRAGKIAMDADETALLSTVRARLGAFPGVTASVEGRRVTLSGAVSDPATMQRVIDAVQGIGNIELDDQLHVAP